MGQFGHFLLCVAFSVDKVPHKQELYLKSPRPGLLQKAVNAQV